MLFEGPFHAWFINVANSRQFWSSEWGKLSQRLVNHSIGQWRRRLKCIVQQQGRHIEHLMWKLRDVTLTLHLLWAIIEAINRLFCAVNFFRMCCYRYRLFTIVAIKTQIFHYVVSLNTWSLVGSSLIVLLQIFSCFQQWNSFENQLILDEVIGV